MAILLNPYFGEAYNNRGIATNNYGNASQVTSDFKTACQLGIEQACENLNRALMKTKFERGICGS